MWAEHLDISRAIALIAEQDLSNAIARMGVSLHVLQRDLVLLSLKEEESAVVTPVVTAKMAEISNS